MSDIFVSYKAEDRRRVKPLVEALHAEGFSVWWDEQIGGGATWRHAIETELNAAKSVVVVWSNRSVGPDGTFVQDEATRAQQRHVYVPVLIDKVHLPLGFGETQALPLSGWRGDRSDPRYEAVLAAVRSNVGSKRRKGVATIGAPVAVDRRKFVVGGAVGAAAVAGIGAWAFLKPSSASASSRSVAVLPFENLSGDPAQAYFSDGIAEEIRSALSRIAGLTVVGRTSSEAVRNDDTQVAAKKLGVANILSGSVRQSASTIRVNAELVDGRSGIDKWSQDYDRNPGDAIKIQTDIAQNVATALSAALGAAARVAVRVGGTVNAEAQDLYLKAKARRQADDSESSLRAVVGVLDSATAVDPNFADAYALKALALCDINGYYTATGERFEPGYIKAAEVAQRAISLAPNLASAHMILAFIRVSQLDIGKAAPEYERGHALAGGDVDDLIAYGRFLAMLGKSGDAIALARQAQARDPLNPQAFSSEADGLFATGRYSKAATAVRKALALAPNKLLARSLLAEVLTQMNQYDEALAELRKMPPDNLFRLVGETVIYARHGNRSASDAALQRAQQAFGDSSNYQYAEIHAARGENDQAFAALDRAWQFRDPGLAILKKDVWLAPLRSDARFAALLQRMNFPTA